MFNNSNNINFKEIINKLLLFLLNSMSLSHAMVYVRVLNFNKVLIMVVLNIV